METTTRPPPDKRRSASCSDRSEGIPLCVALDTLNEGKLARDCIQQPLVRGPEATTEHLGQGHVLSIIGGGKVLSVGHGESKLMKPDGRDQLDGERKEAL